MEALEELHLDIKYDKHIQLSNFNKALSSLDNEIRSYYKAFHAYPIITTIKKGSIEIVIQIVKEMLISQLADSGVNLMIANLKIWYDQLKRKVPSPQSIPQKSASNIVGIAHISAYDNATINIYNIPNAESPQESWKIDNKEQAKACIENAHTYLYPTQEDINSNAKYITNEVFIWEQYKVHTKGAGDKGIIPKISDKSITVLFDNSHHKETMTQRDDRFNCEWQNLCFVVDAEVVYLGSKIISYKITHVNQEKTHILEE